MVGVGSEGFTGRALREDGREGSKEEEDCDEKWKRIPSFDQHLRNLDSKCSMMRYWIGIGILRRRLEFGM